MIFELYDQNYPIPENFKEIGQFFSSCPKPVRTLLVKWKQSGKVNFFRKNLRIQFDVVFDSESIGDIFDSLTPFGCELWRFENLKFVRHLQPTHKIF